MFGIFVGEYSLVGGYAPIDAQCGIREEDTSIGFGVIELVALVAEQRVFAQHTEPVGKTLGDKELKMVILCQLYSYMLAISRATLSDIHSNIKYCALDTAYQL